MDVDFRRHGPLVLGLLSAAIAGLGTLQALLEVASGQAFDIQLLAFWIGASAIMLYVAVFIGGVVAGFILGGLEALSRRELPSILVASIYAAGGLIGVLFASFVILQGVVFDYEGTDAIGRGFMALIGVVAFCGGIWLWRRLTTSSDATSGEREERQ